MKVQPKGLPSYPIENNGEILLKLFLLVPWEKNAWNKFEIEHCEWCLSGMYRKYWTEQQTDFQGKCCENPENNPVVKHFWAGLAVPSVIDWNLKGPVWLWGRKAATAESKDFIAESGLQCYCWILELLNYYACHEEKGNIYCPLSFNILLLCFILNNQNLFI